MKLSVDPTICQGHGLCAAEAPELIELDDSGYATVLGDGEVPEALVVVAQKAVDLCPASALRLA
jgi:ferredoxin